MKIRMAEYLTLSAVAPKTIQAVSMAKVPWNSMYSYVGTDPFPSLTDRPLPNRASRPPTRGPSPVSASEYPTAHQMNPDTAMIPIHCAIVDVMLCFLSIPP